MCHAVLTHLHVALHAGSPISVHHECDEVVLLRRYSASGGDHLSDRLPSVLRIPSVDLPDGRQCAAPAGPCYSRARITFGKPRPAVWSPVGLTRSEPGHVRPLVSCLYLITWTQITVGTMMYVRNFGIDFAAAVLAVQTILYLAQDCLLCCRVCCRSFFK